MRIGGVAVASVLTALAAIVLPEAAPAEAAARGAKAAQGAADAGASSLPACIAVSSESRYVPFGYNHVVIVRNGCSKAAVCRVSTDVNPSVITVDVKAGETAEVLTFMGSPAQTFSARVACALR